MIVWCPHCPGVDLDPVGLPEDRAGRCPACGRLHLERAVRDPDLDRRHAALRPAWWGGASGDEVRAFGLSSLNLPDGSSIPLLDDRALRYLLGVATARLRDRATRMSWLTTYTNALIAEARARAAEAA